MASKIRSSATYNQSSNDLPPPYDDIESLPEPPNLNLVQPKYQPVPGQSKVGAVCGGLATAAGSLPGPIGTAAAGILNGVANVCNLSRTDAIDENERSQKYAATENEVRIGAYEKTASVWEKSIVYTRKENDQIRQHRQSMAEFDLASKKVDYGVLQEGEISVPVLIGQQQVERERIKAEQQKHTEITFIKEKEIQAKVILASMQSPSNSGSISSSSSESTPRIQFKEEEICSFQSENPDDKVLNGITLNNLMSKKVSDEQFKEIQFILKNAQKDLNLLEGSPINQSTVKQIRSQKLVLQFPHLSFFKFVLDEIVNQQDQVTILNELFSNYIPKDKPHTENHEHNKKPKQCSCIIL